MTSAASVGTSTATACPVIGPLSPSFGSCYAVADWSRVLDVIRQCWAPAHTACTGFKLRTGNAMCLDAFGHVAQVNMWRARMGDSRWLESRERDHNITWRQARWLWLYS